MLTLIVLAGCIDPKQQEETGDPAEDPPFAPDCTLTGSQQDGRGMCTVVLDPSDERDQEVDLAVDPSNADRVALGWLEQTPGGPWRVWIATTLDGGGNWTYTDARSLTQVAPQLTPSHFDPTLAYSDQGTLFVLFGEASSRNMHLLSSSDGGTTWEARLVQASLGSFVTFDAMGLAISPGSQTLHVVAHGFVYPGFVAGAWYWRSEDTGQTWSPPERLDPLLHEDPQERFFWARPAAGADGTLAVSVKTADALYVLISTNEGKDWQAAHRVHDGGGSVIGHPVAVHPGGNITLVYGIQDELRIMYTVDNGDHWSALKTIADSPGGLHHNWQVATTDLEGGLFTLQTYGGQDAQPWGVYLAHLDTRDHLTHRSLAGPLEVDRPSSWNSSGNNVDNYGGIGVAADGSIWAAWSDTRDGSPQIRVARLLHR